MASEAELRLRYRTNRFREAGSPVVAMDNDVATAGPSQAPDVEPSNLGAEKRSGEVSDQHSDDSGSTLDTGVASSSIVNEGDSGTSSAEPVSIRKETEVAEPQEDEHGFSQLSRTTVEPVERMDNQPNPPPRMDEAPTSSTPPVASISSNQEEAQLPTPMNPGDLQDDAQLPVGSPATTEPLVTTPQPDYNVEVSTLPQDTAETEHLETRETAVDIEYPAASGDTNSSQLDGASPLAAPLQFSRRNNDGAYAGRSSTGPSDGNDVVADSTATSRDEDAVAEVILPRWQPDAEVTYCPICRTQFNFFFRKHHCRKCGRVVCASCSPHRITIPYQFIVQPPTTGPATTHPGPAPPQPDTYNPSTFGGTKVRLCNPCVPDPNILPPEPQQRTATDERWRVAPPTYYLNSGSRPYAFGEEQMDNLERQTSGVSTRTRATSSLSTAQRRQQLPQGLYPTRSSSQATRLGGTSYTGPHNPAEGQRSYADMNTGRRQGPHHHSHQSLNISSSGSTSNLQPHYRSLLEPFGSQQAQSPDPGVDTSRPLPPVPRVREEDECPVCHRELPSRSLPDFETVRANHVTQCIEDQIAIHSGRPRQQAAFNMPAQDSRPEAASAISSASTPILAPSRFSNPSASPSSSQGGLTLAQAINLPAPTPAPSSYPNTAEGRTAYREAQHAAIVLGHARSPSNSPQSWAASSSFSPGPRRTGMFPYKATEKDCVDDAECTICLEEFEVGVQMARLECLCRFHEKCIRSWWEGKPGRCPVHGHDGWEF